VPSRDYVQIEMLKPIIEILIELVGDFAAGVSVLFNNSARLEIPDGSIAEPEHRPMSVHSQVDCAYRGGHAVGEYGR
jgi:hypothetical protein